MSKKWINFLSNSIFRFVIIGGCSTIIDFIIYMLFSLGFSVILSKGISMVISSGFSYFFNKRFTFRNQEKTNLGYILRFYLLFALNLIVNVGVNARIYSITGHKILAFVFATICGMFVNYLGQRFWVFGKKNWIF